MTETDETRYHSGRCPDGPPWCGYTAPLVNECTNPPDAAGTPVVVEEVTEATPEVVAALRALVPELSSSAPELSDEAVAEIVSSPATVLLVARTGTTILGSLTLVVFTAPTGPRAWIEDVVVAGGARGRGIGAALVHEALARRIHRRLAHRGLDVPGVASGSQPALCAAGIRAARDERLPAKSGNRIEREEPARVRRRGLVQQLLSTASLQDAVLYPRVAGMSDHSVGAR